MTSEEWVRFRGTFAEKRGAIHDDRNHRYAHDDDVLANFKRNARGRVTDLEAWRVYAGKHWDAICALIDDISTGKTVNPAMGEDDLYGSFYDLANYIEFGAALLHERINAGEAVTHSQRHELPLILVDLDDTLWDFVGECCSLVEGGIPERYLWHWGGIYRYLGDRTPAVMEEAQERMAFCDPLPGASEVITELFDWYRVGIVTSQYSGTLNRIRLWLSENSIPCDFILTGQANKAEVARGMDALLLIDDNIETLRETADREVGTACIATRWNIDAEDDDRIRRYQTWSEIGDWLRCRG